MYASAAKSDGRTGPGVLAVQSNAQATKSSPAARAVVRSAVRPSSCRGARASAGSAASTSTSATIASATSRTLRRHAARAAARSPSDTTASTRGDPSGASSANTRRPGARARAVVDGRKSSGASGESSGDGPMRSASPVAVDRRCSVDTDPTRRWRPTGSAPAARSITIGSTYTRRSPSGLVAMKNVASPRMRARGSSDGRPDQARAVAVPSYTVTAKSDEVSAAPAWVNSNSSASDARLLCAVRRSATAGSVASATALRSSVTARSSNCSRTCCSTRTNVSSDVAPYRVNSTRRPAAATPAAVTATTTRTRLQSGRTAVMERFAQIRCRRVAWSCARRMCSGGDGLRAFEDAAVVRPCSRYSSRRAGVTYRR